jgi:sulfite reductase alpha subunit-like flavoprotein
MEPAVRGTLAKIHADHKGLSDEEGARWLVDLEGHDRYHADIFGA